MNTAVRGDVDQYAPELNSRLYLIWINEVRLTAARTGFMPIFLCWFCSGVKALLPIK